MKVSVVKKFIKDKSDDEVVIGMLFDKSDTEYFIEDMNSGITEEEDIIADLSDDEWNQVVECMALEKHLWQTIDDTFDEIIMKVIDNRKKGK